MKDTTAACNQSSSRASTTSRRWNEPPCSTVSPMKNHDHEDNNGGSWDHEAAEATLFQYDLVMSPTHDDHGEGKAPIVGEILDFDGPAMIDTPVLESHATVGHEASAPTEAPAPAEEAHVVEASPSSHEEEEEQVNDESKEEQDNADNCSDEGSVLKLEMFEGVFEEPNADVDGIIPLADEDVVRVVSNPSSTASDPLSDSSVKRPAEADAEEEESLRSYKKAKPQKSNPTTTSKEADDKLPTEIALTTTTTTITKPAASKVSKPPAATSNLISAFQEELVIKQDFPQPKHPRRRRPNCLFVNHFGTRLNGKGESEPVNVPSKNFARISSEESVSIKTKTTASTGRSSKSANTKNTPVKPGTCPSSSSGTKAPSCVPSVVRIVTPTTNKPAIRSSRLEDITMEEDELEPIHHAHDDDDVMVIDTNHLPYITSLPSSTEIPSSPHPPPKPTASPPTPTPANTNSAAAATPNLPATPQMIPPPPHPGMMSPPPTSRMPVNFNRPFPLLQRRAFLAGGCHPMAPHPAQAAAFAAGAAAASWHGAFGHPGMPFPMPPFPGAPVPAAAAAGPPPHSHAQWKKKK